MRSRVLLVVAFVVGCRAASPAKTAPGVDAQCPAPGAESTMVASQTCLEGSAAACQAECDDGVAEACFELGLAAERAEDDASARRWYREGCVRGSTIACTNLGAYAFNDKAPISADCALSLFEHGCALRDHWACAMIGRVHAEGFGRKADPGRARAVLEASCNELGIVPLSHAGRVSA